MFYIHSFIFSKRFFWIWVTVDPEPTLGTLDTKWEHTPYRTSVHCQAPFMHIHTLIHTYNHYSIANPSASSVLEGNQRTCRKFIQTQGELHTVSNLLRISEQSDIPNWWQPAVFSQAKESRNTLENCCTFFF